MNEEVFRKKNMDKLKSPETLDDYIKVSNPGVWLLLVCVIALLVGACVWGFFGHVDSIVPARVEVSDGEAVCFVASSDVTKISEGMEVKFGDFVATVESIEKGENSEYVLGLSLSGNTPDGIYDGKVVVMRYKPISFILN